MSFGVGIWSLNFDTLAPSLDKNWNKHVIFSQYKTFWTGVCGTQTWFVIVLLSLLTQSLIINEITVSCEFWSTFCTKSKYSVFIMPKRVECFGAASQFPTDELPTVRDVILHAKYLQETLVGKSLGLTDDKIGDMIFNANIITFDLIKTFSWTYCIWCSW